MIVQYLAIKCLQISKILVVDLSVPRDEHRGLYRHRQRGEALPFAIHYSCRIDWTANLKPAKIILVQPKMRERKIVHYQPVNFSNIVLYLCCYPYIYYSSNYALVIFVALNLSASFCTVLYIEEWLLFCFAPHVVFALSTLATETVVAFSCSEIL